MECVRACLGLDSNLGERVKAYLGLGSNLGDREANLVEAAKQLEQGGQLFLSRASSIYETAPWGYTEQPFFLNCVLEVETDLAPAPLLARVQAVEVQMGREPGFRYGPRLIDIDILLYGDLVLSRENPDLQIPHPRMEQRAFVLTPLADLAAELVHPRLRLTNAELAHRVEGLEGVKLWAPALDVG